MVTRCSKHRVLHAPGASLQFDHILTQTGDDDKKYGIDCLQVMSCRHCPLNHSANEGFWVGLVINLWKRKKPVGVLLPLQLDCRFAYLSGFKKLCDNFSCCESRISVDTWHSLRWFQTLSYLCSSVEKRSSSAIIALLKGGRKQATSSETSTLL